MCDDGGEVTSVFLPAVKLPVALMYIFCNITEVSHQDYFEPSLSKPARNKLERSDKHCVDFLSLLSLSWMQPNTNLNTLIHALTISDRSTLQSSRRLLMKSSTAPGRSQPAIDIQSNTTSGLAKYL